MCDFVHQGQEGCHIQLSQYTYIEDCGMLLLFSDGTTMHQYHYLLFKVVSAQSFVESGSQISKTVDGAQ